MASHDGDDDLEEGEIAEDSPPNPQSEKLRSATEMEIIHAAMMEELGIGRKDALPLEDKGEIDPLVLKGTKKAKKLARTPKPDDAAAGWRSFKFDDFDPALEGLDSIADGQLYRLRRQGSSSGHTSMGRGGHSSLGTGRGGSAKRGSGVLDIGRGGNHASRTGREPVKDQIGNIANQAGSLKASSRGGSNPTPKTLFKNDRRSPSKRALINAAIQRLSSKQSSQSSPARGSVSQSGSNPTKFKPKPAQTHQGQGSGHQLAKNTNPPAAVSSFALASPEAFLAHAGVASSPVSSKSAKCHVTYQSSSKQIKPTLAATSSQTVTLTPTSTTGRAKEQPPGNAKKSDQGIAEGQLTAPVLATLEIPTSTQVSTSSSDGVKELKTGLASSRWANPVATTLELRSRPPISTSCSEVAGKLNKGSATSRSLASVSVSTLNSASTQVATAEMIPSRVILKEINPVKVSRSNEPFQFGTVRLVKVKDQTNLNLEIEMNGSLVFSETLSDLTTFKVEETQIIFWSGSSEDQSETWRIKFQLPYHQLIFESTLPCKLKDVLPSSQNYEDISDSAINFPSLLAQPVVQQPGPVVTEPAFRAGQISRSYLGDMEIIGDIPSLISFADDGGDPASSDEPLLSSALEDLLALEDEAVIDSTLTHLNNCPDGSFLDQIFSIVTRTELVRGASLKKGANLIFGIGLLSSIYTPQLLSAAEGLVGNFLKHSETFSQLPELVFTNYIKDKSKKVLAKAQAQRRAIHVTIAASTPSGHLFDSVQSPERLPAALAVAVEGPPAVECAEALYGEQDSLAQSSRIISHIVYPITELLNLRNQASAVDKELLSEVNSNAAKLKKQPNLSKPLFGASIVYLKRIIPSNGAGVDTVAEKLEESQISRLASHVLPPSNPATSDQLHDLGLEAALHHMVIGDKQVPMETNASRTGDMSRTGMASDAPEIRPRARHLPTDSDCDRLATTLEGLTLTPSHIAPTSSDDRSNNDSEQQIKPVSSILGITNRELKGVPGLASSKWAGLIKSSPVTPNSRVLDGTFSSQKRQNLCMPTPTPPSTRYNNLLPNFQPATVSCQVSDLAFTNLVELPTGHGPGPVYQSVLVLDPDTGKYFEVTGIAKAGSIPTVAHVRSPKSHPRSNGGAKSSKGKENVPQYPQTPSPSFPSGLTALDRQLSDSPSNSSHAFKPSAPPFWPASCTDGQVRGQSENNLSNDAARPSRSQLQNENLQTALQSRLNRSISARNTGSPTSMEH